MHPPQNTGNKPTDHKKIQIYKNSITLLTMATGTTRNRAGGRGGRGHHQVQQQQQQQGNQQISREGERQQQPHTQQDDVSGTGRPSQSNDCQNTNTISTTNTTESTQIPPVQRLSINSSRMEEASAISTLQEAESEASAMMDYAERLKGAVMKKMFKYAQFMLPPEAAFGGDMQIACCKETNVKPHLWEQFWNKYGKSATIAGLKRRRHNVTQQMKTQFMSKL